MSISEIANMARSSFSPLRRRILLLVLLCALPAFALVIYTGIEHRAYTGLDARKLATGYARHVAAEQEALSRDTERALYALAQLQEVKNLDATQCSETFSRILKLGGPYANLGVIAMDGELVCSGVPVSGSLNLADRSYFQRTVKNKSFAVGDYQIGRIVNRPVLNMSGPVVGHDGQMRGVVFAAVPSDWFKRVAAEIDMPPGFTLTVVDTSLTILTRYPDDEWVGKNVANTPLGDLIGRGAETGTAEIRGLDNRTQLHALDVVQGLGPEAKVMVVVSVPTDVVLHEANVVLFRNLLALVLAIGAVTVAAWWAGNAFILRDVNALVDATNKLASGDRAARVSLVGGVREFATLGETFNEMASGLERHLNRIHRLNRIHLVLSGINRAIVRFRDRQALLNEVCRVAVELGNFRAAWVGFPDHVSQMIVPVAFAGVGEERIRAIQIPLAADVAHGKAVAATAMREERCVVSNDSRNDPALAPWRDLMVQLDFRAVAAFPMMVNGKTEAVLSLYAAESDFFDDEEIRLLQELAADASLGLEYIAKEQQLQFLSYFDPLTRLPNRQLCEDRLRQAVARARHHGRSVAAMIVRLERLRHVTDVGGRGSAEAVLKAIADYLKGAVRDGDTVARYGDYEFAVLLADMRSPEDVLAVTDKIRTERPGTIRVGGTEVVVSFSAGISIYPNDDVDPSTLMQHAQLALDTQSIGAGNVFAFYSDEINQRAHARQHIESALYHALERHEFHAHYQPIVSIPSGKTVGVEALLRWQNANLGNVSPATFIPIAEETGLIVPIGDWVLQESLRQARLWRDQGLTGLKMCVNVSTRQLREPDFMQRVQRILQEGEYDPATLALCLEITESEVMKNVGRTIEMLRELKRLRLSISVDDFGTGYSSLSYLRQLPIDTLKIDVSFIRDIPSSADAVAIARGIVALAHGLGLYVVAEGVETKEQLEALRQMQCDGAQGFLFSAAKPAQEILAFITGVHEN